MQIRNELVGDVEQIDRLLRAAFEGPEEAELVRALRTAKAVTLSLVAVHEDRVLGHILFSPVTVECDAPVGNWQGLGPMAVLPEHQAEGIGTALVCGGLESLRKSGHEAVVVVGHPGYYPRFYFELGSEHGLRWEGGAPEAFFVRSLRGALPAGGGVVRYHPAFGG